MNSSSRGALVPKFSNMQHPVEGEGRGEGANCFIY